MTEQLDLFLSVAKKAATEAGKIQMEYFDKEKEISTKSTETDIVTQVDLLCQEAIIKSIKQEFPDHGFLAEEDDVDVINESGYVWVIDPVDGTVNYANGIPMFCVSIGLRKGNEMLVGVVFSPVLNELFWAAKGQGAYLNGKKISVSKTSKLINSVIGTGFAYDKDTNPDNNTKEFCAVTKRIRGVRRLGSAAIDLVYVACGKLEGYWELIIKPWDIAAGVLILEEAGGLATDLHGNKLQFKTKTSIIATNNHIYNKLSKLLTEVRGGE
jgi:myo-inositol-1(or 4)-monophosphatase